MFQVETELNLLDDDRLLSDFLKCLVFHEVEFKVVARDTKVQLKDQSLVFDPSTGAQPPTVRFKCRTKTGLVVMITQGWGIDQSLINQIKESPLYD